MRWAGFLRSGNQKWCITSDLHQLPAGEMRNWTAFTTPVAVFAERERDDYNRKCWEISRQAKAAKQSCQQTPHAWPQCKMSTPAPALPKEIPLAESQAGIKPLRRCGRRSRTRILPSV